MFCPECGKELVEGARFCTNCGADIEKKLGFAPKDELNSECAGAAKEETHAQQEAVGKKVAPKSPPTKKPDEGGPAAPKNVHSVHNLGTIVGKNQDYYREEFHRAEYGIKCKFNWAAFLLGPAFCFYRRCGELFKKYFLVSSILMLFGYMVEVSGMRRFDLTMMFCGMIIVTIGSIVQVINMIRLGRRFNQDYYKHCINSAAELPDRTGTSVKSAICFCIITSQGMRSVSPKR